MAVNRGLCATSLLLLAGGLQASIAAGLPGQDAADHYSESDHLSDEPPEEQEPPHVTEMLAWYCSHDERVARAKALEHDMHLQDASHHLYEELCLSREKEKNAEDAPHHLHGWRDDIIPELIVRWCAASTPALKKYPTECEQAKADQETKAEAERKNSLYNEQESAMIAWWCAGLLTQGAHGGRPVPCILLAASHLTIPTDFPLHLHAICS
jgi:hypothetical protein